MSQRLNLEWDRGSRSWVAEDPAFRCGLPFRGSGRPIRDAGFAPGRGQDGHGSVDRSDVVEGRVVAKADSSLRSLTSMHKRNCARIVRRSRPQDRGGHGSAETEPALNVVIVYQDPLTRHWAAESVESGGAGDRQRGHMPQVLEAKRLDGGLRFRGRSAGGRRGGRAGDFGPRRRRTANIALRVD